MIRDPSSTEQLSKWSSALEIAGADALVDRFKLQTTQLSELLLYIAPELGSSTNWASDLIKLGADPNYVDSEGNTALSLCIHASAAPSPIPHSQSFDAATVLLANGADPNQCYGQNCSVTALALAYERRDLVSLLLCAGADLCRKEPDAYDGRTLRNVMEESNFLWAKSLALIAMRVRR